MKKLVFLSFLCISAMLSNAQTVFGKWKTIDDETGDAKSIVEVYEHDGKVYGRIIELFRKPEQDQDPLCTACKGSKKGQKIRGMVVMENLEKDDDEYEDGTIIDPNNGKVYDCKIWLDGSNKLMVRGYVGIFYRTQEWLRAE